jgi:hypothetical protein
MAEDYRIFCGRKEISVQSNQCGETEVHRLNAQTGAFEYLQVSFDQIPVNRNDKGPVAVSTHGRQRSDGRIIDDGFRYRKGEVLTGLAKDRMVRGFCFAHLKAYGKAQGVLGAANGDDSLADKPLVFRYSLQCGEEVGTLIRYFFRFPFNFPLEQPPDCQALLGLFQLGGVDILFADVNPDGVFVDAI